LYRTRAVQKLIETLKSPEQVAMVIKALADGVVELIKDLNGNHVVQRCLQKLSHEDNQVCRFWKICDYTTVVHVRMMNQ
jgi:Mg/Co/Ni transporter MgtE